MLKIERITTDNAPVMFNRFIEQFPSLHYVAFSDVCKAASSDPDVSADALRRIHESLDLAAFDRWWGKVAVVRLPPRGRNAQQKGWVTKVVVMPYVGDRHVRVRFRADGTVFDIVADFRQRPSLTAAQPLLHGWGSSGNVVKWVQTCTCEEERPRFLAAGRAALRRMVRNGTIDQSSMDAALEWAQQLDPYREWTLDHLRSEAVRIDDAA